MQAEQISSSEAEFQFMNLDGYGYSNNFSSASSEAWT